MASYNKSRDDEKKKKNESYTAEHFAVILSVSIVRAMSRADKYYRFTICREVEHLSYDILHELRRANEQWLGSEKRVEHQNIALEKTKDFKDLLKVLEGCRCITIGEKADIDNRADIVKQKISNWMENDKVRINRGELEKLKYLKKPES